MLIEKILGFVVWQFMLRCGGGGGGGGGDGGAQQRYEQQRADEAARQARIASSIKAINDAFAGFDDNYYRGLSKSYTDYYTPEMDRQYNVAKLALPTQFGSTDGSEFQRRAGEFETDNLKQRADMAQAATDFAGQQRSRVEQQRSSLISQANSVADPNASASLAASYQKALATPTSFSPLGDLFSKYTGNMANATAAQNAGYAPTPMGQRPLLFGGSGRTAERVVSGG
jgi:hypothetical protein